MDWFLYNVLRHERINVSINQTSKKTTNKNNKTKETASTTNKNKVTGVRPIKMLGTNISLYFENWSVMKTKESQISNSNIFQTLDLLICISLQL